MAWGQRNDHDDVRPYQPPPRPTCKHCGVRILWLKKDFKWIPSDPETGEPHRCLPAATSDFNHLGAKK